MPHNRLGEIQKINKASSDFEQTMEREPTDEELAEILDMDLEKVQNSRKMSKKQASLDAPMANDEDNNSLISVIEGEGTPAPNDTLIHESLSTDIERTLSYLKGMEAEVIRLFYGLSGRKEMTLEEIGSHFGLTRERIRQIKERGLRRMRRLSRTNNLQTYL